MNNVLSLPVAVFVLTTLLVAALAIYLWLQLGKARRDQQQAEKSYNELSLRIHSLELETLEARLNPHLFKNILNSIQSHAYQTYFALDKMASVLDYILYESRKKFVTPREEVDFALNLIEINKIKVSPLFELKVKQKINDNEPLLHQQLLAPMVSIDLIENAFKHADLQSQDAFISITFEFKDDQFMLHVSNKISPVTPPQKTRGGLGMQTLDQRLKIIYGDHYKLTRFTEGDVFIAQLKINLLGYKTQMLAHR